jgi:hypothetical protein
MFYGNGKVIRVYPFCAIEVDLEEGSGTITADVQDWSTKYATLVDDPGWVTTVTAVHGTWATSHDGTTQRIQASADIANWHSNDDWTMTGWVAPLSIATTASGYYTNLFGRWNVDSLQRGAELILINTADGEGLAQNVGIALSDSDGDVGFIGYTDTTLEAEYWAFLAATFKSTSTPVYTTVAAYVTTTDAYSTTYTGDYPAVNGYFIDTYETGATTLDGYFSPIDGVIISLFDPSIPAWYFTSVPGGFTSADGYFTTQAAEVTTYQGSLINVNGFFILNEWTATLPYENICTTLDGYYSPVNGIVVTTYNPDVPSWTTTTIPGSFTSADGYLTTSDAVVTTHAGEFLPVNGYFTGDYETGATTLDGFFSSFDADGTYTEIDGYFTTVDAIYTTHGGEFFAVAGYYITPLTTVIGEFTTINGYFVGTYEETTTTLDGFFSETDDPGYDWLPVDGYITTGVEEVVTTLSGFFTDTNWYVAPGEGVVTTLDGFFSLIDGVMIEDVLLPGGFTSVDGYFVYPGDIAVISGFFSTLDGVVTTWDGVTPTSLAGYFTETDVYTTTWDGTTTTTIPGFFTTANILTTTWDGFTITTQSGFFTTDPTAASTTDAFTTTYEAVVSISGTTYGAHGDLHVYVDGNEKTVHTLFGEIPPICNDSAADFVIGAAMDDTTPISGQHGGYDDIILFNKALTADNIKGMCYDPKGDFVGMGGGPLEHVHWINGPIHHETSDMGEL